ncbi:hypothetical protein VTI74DRAFT_8121 [Chaetomium olivicolor]
MSGFDVWRDVFTDLELENPPSQAVLDEPFDFGVVPDNTLAAVAPDTLLDPALRSVMGTQGTMRDAPGPDLIDLQSHHELTKEALLRNIRRDYQERHEPQNSELVRSFRGLLWRDVEVYELRRHRDSETNAAGCVKREFAFRCIDVMSKLLDSSLDPTLDSPAGLPPDSAPSPALAHVITGLGAHLMRADGHLPRDAYASAHNPLTQFEAALHLRSKMLDSAFSLVNLQGHVAIAYFAARIGSRETARLVSGAIHYVQVMRLCKSSTIERLCAILADRQQVMRAVWFLYALEKEICLRDEIFPVFLVFDREVVDYNPPPSGNMSELDSLSIRCCYGSLCAGILRESFGQTSPRGWQMRHQSIQHLHDLLEAWLHMFPEHVRAIIQQDDFIIDPSHTRNMHANGSTSNHTDADSTSTQEQRHLLVLFFQYHEAVMAIHTVSQHPHPQAPDPRQPPQLQRSRHSVSGHSTSATSGGTSGSAGFSGRGHSETVSSNVSDGPRTFVSANSTKSGSRADGDDDYPFSYTTYGRESSARSILAASCLVTAPDVRSYPHLYRIVCVAACALAAATIRNGDAAPSGPDSGSGPSSGRGSAEKSDERRDLSYLVTAAGFVGRMALAGIEGPLEEITEVVRAVQQAIKGKQRH